MAHDSNIFPLTDRQYRWAIIILVATITVGILNYIVVRLNVGLSHGQLSASVVFFWPYFGGAILTGCLIGKRAWARIAIIIATIVEFIIYAEILLQSKDYLALLANSLPAIGILLILVPKRTDLFIIPAVSVCGIGLMIGLYYLVFNIGIFNQLVTPSQKKYSSDKYEIEAPSGWQILEPAEFEKLADIKLRSGPVVTVEEIYGNGVCFLSTQEETKKDFKQHFTELGFNVSKENENIENNKTIIYLEGFNEANDHFMSAEQVISSSVNYEFVCAIKNHKPTKAEQMFDDNKILIKEWSVANDYYSREFAKVFAGFKLK